MDTNKKKVQDNISSKRIIDGCEGQYQFLSSLKVAFFLAVREIKRANIWTTILTIAVMVLTFLNLVVVSGILIGLIEGAVEAVRTRYLSDVYISTLKQRSYIEKTSEILNVSSKLPEVLAVSPRYIEGGSIETDYNKQRKASELKEIVNALFVGIDVKAEDAVTGLSKYVIEGSYLEADDYDQVLVGAMLLKKYIDFESSGFPVLDNVEVGKKIKLQIAGNTREVFVKGILKTKLDEIDRRVFFIDSQFRGLINRFDYNVDEIAIKLRKGADPVTVRDTLISYGFDKYAKIQTAEDAEPKFIKDMKKTFSILGAIISSIGLVVASITVFIVVFINAITRRKFIGILKGIGIYDTPIKISYVIQSVFYALCGIAIGAVIVFGFLKPYIDANPINFPFSDGILVATVGDTTFKALILFVATMVAGYIPARLVVRQNTLDAILGR
jgi:ABC-type lipoprotein release transport system permease subunit